MLPLERLQAAQQRIADTLLPTPMLLDHVLSERLGRSVWLKAELCQRTGSFKSRGALHWVRTASRQELAGGLGAVSAGNPALWLGWGAGPANVTGTSVMLVAARRFKGEGSRALAA